MRPRGFTLVELLVVIAIIALLLAISFASTGALRRRAQAVACQANIHQLQLSLHDYDADHQSLPYGFDFKGGLMPPGRYVGDGHLDLMGWWWFHYAGILRHRSEEEKKILRCPAGRLDDFLLDRDVLWGKYGVNRALCKAATSWSRRIDREAGFAGTPLSVSDLRRPSSTLLIADSGYTLISWWNATAAPPVALDPDSNIEDTAYIPGLQINREKTLRSGQSVDALGGRHPNMTVNVGFADGHVTAKSAAELLVKKTGEAQYTNMLLWMGE